MAIPVAGPKALLANKGHDGDRVRESLPIRRVLPMISRHSKSTVPEHPDYCHHRDRNRVERMSDKLKQQRRIAARYKADLSFKRVLNLAAAHLWLKSLVNTTEIKRLNLQ